MKQIALIILVVMAISTVRTKKMRHAVIYMGVFSLGISFVYMLYNAPDVAIAETVIGSTLATILYLVALKKYKIFTIYYRVGEAEINDEYTQKKNIEFINLIESFCVQRELDPHIIYTTEQKEEVMKKYRYALIVEEYNNQFIFYRHPENCQLDDFENFILEQQMFSISYTTQLSQLS